MSIKNSFADILSVQRRVFNFLWHFYVFLEDEIEDLKKTLFEESSSNGAIGKDATTVTGGAAGDYSHSTNGFAGGENAVASAYTTNSQGSNRGYYATSGIILNKTTSLKEDGELDSNKFDEYNNKFKEYLENDLNTRQLSWLMST